jgi:hypothetical protein
MIHHYNLVHAGQQASTSKRLEGYEQYQAQEGDESDFESPEYSLDNEMTGEVDEEEYQESPVIKSEFAASLPRPSTSSATPKTSSIWKTKFTLIKTGKLRCKVCSEHFIDEHVFKRHYFRKHNREGKQHNRP